MKRKDRQLDKALIIIKQMERAQIPAYDKLLPLLFRLKDGPYSLDDFFPFEPIFRFSYDRASVWKTGRQVAKTTSLGGSSVARAGFIPNYSILHVTPLFEQVRRLSHNYVRPFIDNSVFRSVWLSDTVQNSVLQRSFSNGSSMHFGYASDSPDRLRGYPVDHMRYDEIQDFDFDFLKIINAALSASKWKIVDYFGTPKTLENGIEKELWADSSQGEWVTQCRSCRKENVASVSHDLIRMLGPWHKNISRARPGTICANSKCGYPLFTREGRYVHRFPNKRIDLVGRHVPQPIMPMHNERPEEWRLLLKAANSVDQRTFYNEILGESYDSAMKLVTLTSLQQAGNLGPKSKQLAIDRAEKYTHRVLSIDWGGGGEKTSFTVYTMMGIRPDGIIEVPYAQRSMTPGDEQAEALTALQLASEFKAHLIAHDFGGTGYVREGQIVDAGFPRHRIVPISYTGPRVGSIIAPNKAAQVPGRERDYYSVDKTRSLDLTCKMIKHNRVRFFNDDYNGKDEPGLLREFLALYEHRADSMRGGDIYLIRRTPTLPDDFAQSVNIGCVTLWQVAKMWPKLNEISKYQISAEYLDVLNPPNPNW